MNTYGTIVPGLSRIRETKTLSKTAKRRLNWLEFYDSHGQNARLTCRHFGLSPDVFYRWKNRYQRYNLSSLEDTPSRPKTFRRSSTDPLLVARIKGLREQYPRWGKKKLYAIVTAEGFMTSESSVGRTLNRLRARGILKEPAIVTARLAGKKRRYAKRLFAERRDWAYIPKQPGDLVQVDTLHITTKDSKSRYQFTASDYISKYTARRASFSITSTAASHMLDTIFERMPTRPKVIQVDGGSEFKAVFEKACHTKGVRLFVLPPHSPKLNGVVERMNRTSREEIYDLGLVMATTLEEHNQLLVEQDYVYNHIRPHEALGMKTPQAYYECINN
jgi:transposase InsO family protein